MSRIPTHCLFILGLAIVLGDVASVAARPYRVVARYGPSGQSPTRQLTLRPDAEIPDAGLGAPLQDVALTFDATPFGMLPAQVFDPFTVTAEVGAGGAAKVTAIDVTKLGEGGTYTALRWQPARDPSATVVHVTITVRARLSDAFVCAVEASLRDREFAKRPAVKTPAAPAAAGPPFPLVVDGAALAVSACGYYAPAGTLAADKLAADRETLRRALAPAITQFFTPWTTLDAGGDAGETAIAFEITERFEFDVFRTAQIFEAYEYRNERVEELTSLVDIDSQISFAALHDSTYCPSVLAAPFRYELQELGDATTRVAVTPRPIETCELVLPIELGAFRKARGLAVRAVYDVDDGQTLTLYERQFAVRELGFISTVPVLTQLQTAVNGWSKDQLRAQTALPLSFAVGLGAAGNGVALTFPWKISYASRSSPNSAELFALCPHLSVIVTEADGDTTPITLAAGVGVGFANALYLSWAAGFSGPHDGDHFLLVGVDIPSLAGLSPSL